MPSVQPREASDRLIIFQNTFDSLFRKYTTYTGGEELFGLSVSAYPRLHQIRKELNLLQKLYGLYNNVIDTVNGYYDIPWQDVNIEKINNEILEFQNRYRSVLVKRCCLRQHVTFFIQFWIFITGLESHSMCCNTTLFFCSLLSTGCIDTIKSPSNLNVFFNLIYI